MNTRKKSRRIHMFLGLLLLLASAAPALGQVVITPLTQGVPTSVTTSPFAYSITIQQSNWNVVGISWQSFDWTLMHGGATSAQGPFLCDFVLADGHAGAIAGSAGTATTAGAIPVRGIICHAAHGPTLTPGTAGNYAWQNDVIYFWEVQIANPGTYNITATLASSVMVPNMMYAWFNPQNTSNWFDRSPAAFVNQMGTPQNNYNITAAGTYCLVVFEDATAGLTTGTVTVSVTSTGGSPSFQAGSISVTGAPVTVNPGGTFQANSSIRNTGTAAGSTNYTIYLSTDNIITTADTQVYSGTTPSIAIGGTHNAVDTCTVPGAMPVGNYYAGLYIAAGNTAVTASADVIVAAAGSPPGPFNLALPGNGSSGISTNPLYSWTASTGAATYTLQVATDAGMSNKVVNKSGITGTSDTPATTLASGTLYYWQVIAVNGFGTATATGAPWSFTTTSASAPPGPFSLVSPVNGASGVSTSPTYSWSAASGAGSYRLQVALDAGMGTLVIDKPGIITLFDSPATALGPGTTYYWQVIAVNALGTTPSTGAPWSFTTEAFDPDAVSITLLDVPVQVPRGSTFRVTRDIINNGSVGGSVSFDIYLSTDNVIETTDILLFAGMTGTIAPSATDSLTLTLTVPSSAVEGEVYYVGLFISTAKRVASADRVTVIRVEPESALGCSGGSASGSGSRRGPGLIPLAFLAVLLFLCRKRRARGGCPAGS